MNLPDEAVDAAVDALLGSTLGDRPGINGEEFVEAARAALEAAAPHIIAALKGDRRVSQEEQWALRQHRYLLDALLVIHADGAGVCIHCRAPYPCATMRAVDRYKGLTA